MTRLIYQPPISIFQIYGTFLKEIEIVHKKVLFTHVTHFTASTNFWRCSNLLGFVEKHRPGDSRCVCLHSTTQHIFSSIFLHFQLSRPSFHKGGLRINFRRELRKPEIFAEISTFCGTADFVRYILLWRIFWSNCGQFPLSAGVVINKLKFVGCSLREMSPRSLPV